MPEAWVPVAPPTVHRGSSMSTIPLHERTHSIPTTEASTWTEDGVSGRYVSPGAATSLFRKRSDLVRDFSSITRATHSESPRGSHRSSSSVTSKNHDKVAPATAPSSKPKNSQYFVETSDYSTPKQSLRKLVLSPTAKRSAPALSDSTSELREIQQSVQRLRSQRTHVEHLRQDNERLETMALAQKSEMERLRYDLSSLRGVEQENVGLLQSFKLLEERLQALEQTCHDQRYEIKTLREKKATAEQERERVRNALEELHHEQEEQSKAYQVKQNTLFDRIKHLEREISKYKDIQSRFDGEWNERLQAAQAQHEAKHQLELNRMEQEKRQAFQTVSSLERQVQTLLATTVRQTTMIEECDRALSETRSNQSQAKNGYQEQMQRNEQLQERIQRLETQLATVHGTATSDREHWEKTKMELESKLAKRKDRIDVLLVALQQKEKELDATKLEYQLHDRTRVNSEEVFIRFACLAIWSNT